MVSVLFLLIGYNIVKCYSGYNNAFLLDVKRDFVLYENKASNTDFFLDEKEYNRLGQGSICSDKLFCFESQLNVDELERMFETHEFWKNAVLFALYEKMDLNKRRKMFEFAKKNGIDFKVVRQYHTGKNLSKLFSLYYVPKYVPPLMKERNGLSNDIIDSILANGELKTFSLKKDAYIFQIKNKLYWIIGSEIDEKTEIIYHIDTTSPGLLPKNRIQYQFDNRAFYPGSKYEIDRIGKYRVFERVIPEEFPVKRIRVGLSKKGEESAWFHSFKISDYKTN